MLGELSNLVTHRFSGRIGRTDRRGCAQLLLESGSAFLLNVRALLWLQDILAGLQSVHDQMTLIQEAGTV